MCWQQVFLERLQIEPLLGRRDTFLFLMHELFEGWLGGDMVMKTPIFRGLELVTLVVLASPVYNSVVVFSDPTVL